MKKSEILALLADKADDDEVDILGEEPKGEKGEKGLVGPRGIPAPKGPEPTEIKSDTIITGTVAEILQQLAPILNKSEEKPKPQEEESAEVYI